MTLSGPFVLRDAEADFSMPSNRNSLGAEMTVSVRGVLTPGLAELLGVKDLIFDARSAPRSGFRRIDLFAQLGEVSVKTDSGLNPELSINPDAVGDFIVRPDPGGTLRLSFKIWMEIQSEATAMTLSRFFFAARSRLLTLAIEPLQRSFDFVPGAAGAVDDVPGGTPE